MALQVLNIERKFTLKKKDKTIDLPDPNPSMSPDDVVKMYAGTYPELTTAKLSGPKVTDNRAEYVLEENVGTKG